MKVFRPVDLLSVVYSKFPSVFHILQCVNSELIVNNMTERRHVLTCGWSLLTRKVSDVTKKL